MVRCRIERTLKQGVLLGAIAFSGLSPMRVFAQTAVPGNVTAHAALMASLPKALRVMISDSDKARTQPVVTKMAAPSLSQIVATALGIPKPAEVIAAVNSTLSFDGLPRFAFLEEQMKFARVRDAQQEKDALVRDVFAARGVSFPSPEIMLRAFKRERTLELWARNPGASRYKLIKQYSICTLGAGHLGPKRRQGDEQMPEGLYHIAAFNPQSNYHLSLRIDFPNRVDRVLNPGVALGGDIMIHGGCRTVGCLAITDEAIKELYWVVAGAYGAGQNEIPVDIYPTRMSDAAFTQLKALEKDPKVVAFWTNLKESYDIFERDRSLPEVKIDEAGRYKLGE